MQTLKPDTRKRILKVAKKLFLDKGYRDATTRDIARMSGVGLSNLYHYYASKDELFTQLEEILMHDLPEEETRSALSEYIQFELIGWKKMMKI